MNLEDIIHAVAAAHNLYPEELTGISRDRRTVTFRHFAMFLARRETAASLPELGRAFHRHHTTVFQAIRKWEIGNRYG